MIIVQPGSTVTLSVYIRDEVDPTNEPVTGQAVTVSVRRRSDDRWWDWVAGAWDVATWVTLGAEHKATMTDQGDGSYERTWDQATADASVQRDYDVVYAIAAGTYQAMVHEVWRFSSEGLALAADLSTVSANVLRTLGLAQENQHIDNVTTDIYGRMTSARMRTYSAAGSVGTASDVLATYTITATYTGAEEAPTTYSVVRV